LYDLYQKESLVYWPEKATPDPEDFIKNKKVWREHFEWYCLFIAKKPAFLQETLKSNANYVYLKFMYDTW